MAHADDRDCQINGLFKAAAQFMKDSNYTFFTEQLIAWFDKDPARRPMPWKGEKDPYKIWLSEIILQQTRVEQGWKYFERFVNRFPTVKDLAKADQDEVMALWKGLGYYSRARNLHHTARVVSEEYEGLFPRSKLELQKLKGVGEYTASAIASFAFEEPAAVLDGNVIRIISRFFGIKEDVTQTQVRKKLQQIADELISEKRPADFNQAIMDFGALVCTPSNPDCSQCPMREHCRAYSEGLTAEIPFKSPKKAKRERFFHFLVITNKEGDLWLEKRQGKDIWQNLYQLPLIESTKVLNPRELTLKLKDERPELVSTETPEIYPKAYKQTLSHQLIHARFYKIPTLVDSKPADTDWVAVSKDKLDTFAIPKVVDCYFIDDWLN